VQVACESDSSDSEVEDNEEVDEEGFQTWEGRLHAAVTERLAAETDRSRLTDCWLLRHLSANGWWLRAGAVNIDQHGQLKLSDGACDPHYRMFKDMSQEASTFYEVDTQVVLPDLMWGCRLSCPTCGCDDETKVHSHAMPVRRVQDLHQDYNIFGRRHACNRCQKVAQEEREKLVGQMREQGVPEAEMKAIKKMPIDVGQYTFMSYNQTTLEKLPYGRSDYFSFVLRKRSAFSKRTITLLRALFDAGVPPERLSAIWKEMKCAQYFMRRISFEEEVRFQRLSTESTTKEDKGSRTFSEFADPLGYNGRYPRGRELIKLVIEWHASARPYFDCEAKKRGGRQLHIDASYKTAKHIGLYHGNRLFKGVISGLNEDGDIRVLHMAVTDGHDQLETVFDELAHTQAQYGLDPIQVVSTDKPADERNFYERKFPAVRQLCDRINSSSDGRLTDAEGTGKDGLKQIDEGRIQFVRYVNNAAAINNSCDNLRDIVAALPESFQVIGLDGEWDTPKDARGLPIGQDRMALVQLAFPIEAEENFRVGVVLCHVVGMKKLPARMWALLADSNFKFIGRQVGGDISKMCRDFGAGRLKQYVQTEDLGTMASKSDIVQHGTATLDKIVANLFGVKLLKDPAIRLSKWSQQQLSDAQLRYAALDPYASLLAYFSLAALPDRTARLSRDEAILGATVDIVPASGLISQLGTRAAIAIIEGVDSTAPPVPHPCVPGKLVAAKKDQIVVRVVQVADIMLTEKKHRFNHRNAERRRLGFPRIGHYDTWLIDRLQILHEQNYGGRLFPGWSNTCDFIITSESTTILPLHSEALGDAVRALQLDKTKITLTADQKYLAEKLRVPIPFLPIHSKEERKLFSLLMLERGADSHSKLSGEAFNVVALEFCRRADGITIFPKLPVYLRLYHASWQQQKRVTDAVTHIKDTLHALRHMMEESCRSIAWAPAAPPPANTPTVDAQPARATGGASATDAASTGDNLGRDEHDGITTDGIGPTITDDIARVDSTGRADDPTREGDGTIPYAEGIVGLRPELPQPPNFPDAPANAFVTHVAGMALQPQGDGTSCPPGKKRAGRPCLRCMQFNSSSTAWSCAGRGGEKFCRHFTSSGELANLPKRTRVEAPCRRCVTSGNSEQAASCPGRGHRTNKCRYFNEHGHPRVE